VPGVEAARVLKTREGTLYRRLHDARKRLRAALEREGPC
jgi:DNA-directed RNA polymerase specialized sigma24 family protein